MLNKKRARKAAKSIEISGFLGSFAYMRKNAGGNLCKKFSAPKMEKCRKKGGEKVASRNEDKIYENMRSLEEWAFAGLSQKEMAEMLGMAYSTFRKLRGEIPALSALLKKSADFLKAEQKKEIEKVEVSLLNRCLGYNADIRKHMKVKKPMLGADGKVLTDANGKVITEEVLEEVTEQQHIPADVGAIKFYLLNKAKDKWKENPDRLELEKKRVANDTKRTKLAEQAASGGGVSGKTIEELLEEAESGGADAEV